MNSRARLTCLCLFIFMFNFLSCAYSTKLTEDFEKSLPLRPGSKLYLGNVNGSVTVTSWDKDEVKIMATKTVKANSRQAAEKYMEELKIVIDESPDGIRIETEHPRRKSGSTFWDLFSGGWSASFSVKYELVVPNRLDLEVQTTNGSVNIQDVNGEIITRSTNGQLELVDLAGKISARTTNGAIEAEVTAFGEEDELLLKTTNGRISVRLPDNLNARLYARTTNGHITTDFPITFDGGYSKKRIEGTIGNGGGKIDLKTTNGSVSIEKR